MVVDEHRDIEVTRINSLRRLPPRMTTQSPSSTNAATSIGQSFMLSPSREFAVRGSDFPPQLPAPQKACAPWEHGLPLCQHTVTT